MALTWRIAAQRGSHAVGILLFAALAAADDHIHASHADIELARDFRVDKHHKIIVSNIGDEDLGFLLSRKRGQ